MEEFQPRTRSVKMFYSGARRIVQGFNWMFWSAEVTYEAPMPKPPYILSPNHRSFIDTVLVGSITGDPMAYMAKVGVFRKAWFARLLRLLGGFPVDPDAPDREAIDIARHALESGLSLVIFPEGTRRQGIAVKDIAEGASYLALKESVPVVPVGIAGSELGMPKGSNIIFPVAISIVVGQAINPAPRLESRRVARGQIRAHSEELEHELDRLSRKAHEALAKRKLAPFRKLAARGYPWQRRGDQSS